MVELAILGLVAGLGSIALLMWSFLSGESSEEIPRSRESQGLMWGLGLGGALVFGGLTVLVLFIGVDGFGPTVRGGTREMLMYLVILHFMSLAYVFALIGAARRGLIQRFKGDAG